MKSIYSEQADVVDIVSVLNPYKQKIDVKLIESFTELGPKNILQEACKYAVSNGGKRFRPAIVLMVAQALGNMDVSEAALAVELFHTASLVADDLPCMDDDDERRNRPSLHKVYGETIALLVSYALIAAGYECLAKNARIVNSEIDGSQICLLALENATFNTGLSGATGGQFLDVFPPDFSLKTLREVIHKKTVSLFEIAFVLGWLYGGGAHEKLDSVKMVAGHFGMAFQIADDLEDIEQDQSNGRKVNIALAFGKDDAVKMFHEEISLYYQKLRELELESLPLHYLAQSLIQRANTGSKRADFR